MSLVEQLENQLSNLRSQIDNVPTQLRTVRIERTNCINLGSQFAAKSIATQTCREIPIFESYYTPQDQNTLLDLQNQFAIKKAELQRILDDAAEQAKALLPRNTEPIKLNDTAASPNAVSLGIPSIIVIAGIIGLFILGRKN